MGEKPKNYLIESILVTLCCCLPIGIAGIVYAAQVDSKWDSGNYAGAQEAAANAKKFVLIAFAIGIVVQFAGIAINIAANAGRIGNG